MNHDPLGYELGRAISAPFERHAAASPYQKNVNRATWGAGLLSWCIYPVAMAGGVGGADELPLWFLAAYGGAVLLALLWLGVGLAGTRGARDLMLAVWSAVIASGCAALLFYAVYPDWGPLAAFLIKGSYFGLLASSAVRCWVGLGLAGGSARRMVTRHIGQHAPLFRPARRRRFFFF